VPVVSGQVGEENSFPESPLGTPYRKGAPSLPRARLPSHDNRKQPQRSRLLGICLGWCAGSRDRLSINCTERFRPFNRQSGCRYRSRSRSLSRDDIATMRITRISILVGTCNGKDCVYALDREAVVSGVRSHYAYGNPNVDEYAVSDTWATASFASGWQIREVEVDAANIAVEFRGPAEGARHIVWKCPHCGSWYSDDWDGINRGPFLLTCTRNGETHFMVGIEPDPATPGS
jgi:hypothetical protein